ncbi:MAG TPA: hypothetical protein VEB20_22395 [Azospirillaceae bacterium]|nr:hypothetical protein [Azospirillaceae bacterium]
MSHPDEARSTALLKARLLARCVDLVRAEAASADGPDALEALADLIGDLRADQEHWLACAGIRLAEAA